MEKDYLAKFVKLEPQLVLETGGPVHLIRVIGSRWSYVAGAIPADMPFIIPQKVILSEEWVLLFYPKEGVCIDGDSMRALFV